MKEAQSQRKGSSILVPYNPDLMTTITSLLAEIKASREDSKIQACKSNEDELNGISHST